MKAPAFHYHRPSTIDEAVGLLRSLENARVLAGGQSLMPMLNLRLADPDHLIDLGAIRELISIREADDCLEIGAMTTQRALERSELISASAPLLAEAVRHIGHQQTRNRGTIGGSLCHLDPGAELPVVAAALDAKMIAIGPAGRRDIAFANFPAGYLTSSLASDEFLSFIRIPKATPRTGTAFVEFNRRPADFAIVSVAVFLSLGDDDRIVKVAISLGGSYAAPVRLRAAEASMIGHLPESTFFDAAAVAASNVPCDGDAQYPAEYRRELAGTLVLRALRLAAARVEGRTYA